jgi:WD40 repeat protein
VVFRGHTGNISTLALAADGLHIASADEGRTLRLWDLENHAMPARLDSTPIGDKALAFLPSTTQLAAGGSDGTIRLWDLQKPQSLPTLFQRRGPVSSLAASVDGGLIASGGPGETIEVWNARNAHLLPILLTGYSGTVRALSFSPDGTRIVAGSSPGTGPITPGTAATNYPLNVWNIKDPDKSIQLGPPAYNPTFAVAFLPDGNNIAIANSPNVGFRDVRNPTNLSAGPPLRTSTGAVQSLSLSPDGKRLATAGGDNNLRIWEISKPSAPLLLLRGHTKTTLSVAYAADGLRLVSTASDNTVRLWDLRDLSDSSLLLQGYSEQIRVAAFSPDGLSIAAGGDGGVFVWPLSRAAADQLCTRIRRNLSLNEWRLYMGKSIPYERTCPALPPGAGVSVKD